MNTFTWLNDQIFSIWHLIKRNFKKKLYAKFLMAHQQEVLHIPWKYTHQIKMLLCIALNKKGASI
jgi:hypothetical protein